MNKRPSIPTVSPVPRRNTDPGGFTAEEADTQPSGGLDPDALAMVRLFDALKSNEKRSAVRLLQGWASCTIDRRVLIEALARELAKIHAAEV